MVADPQDDVGGDCEKVRRVDLGLVPEIGDPLWEFPTEVGMREYNPNLMREACLNERLLRGLPKVRQRGGLSSGVVPCSAVSE